MKDLSILIPARNEMFLDLTIQDIIKNAKSDYEIIAVLDGEWPVDPIPQHSRLTMIHYPESIGQRAATNRAASMSSGKYIMKCDAHCAFDSGFDLKMIELMEPDITMVPVMKNLHAFDWVCKCGKRIYQGPTPDQCPKCGGEMEIAIVWKPRRGVESTAYRFDRDMHFQYWNEFGKSQKGDLTETMSLQGSCFMLTREKYFELDISSETDFHSWGQQGVEVACKTWLSGGRVMVNRNTWYAHMFRTQGGDFGFPYPLSGDLVHENRERSRQLFEFNQWPGAKRPFSWLIDKFNPPDWNKNKSSIIYYTCNTHDPKIDNACRKQLLESGLTIISVSLNKNIDFGNKRVVMEGQRGAEMMHRQILEGLKNCDSDYVFLCESDVLYHPSHFLFTPKRTDVFYYNTNVWKMRADDGHMVWTDDLQQVSGLCASKELLLDFYTKRLEQIMEFGFNGHYEPGVKQTIYSYQKGGKYGTENWKSKFPNICIRHGSNLTKSKWSPDEFRNKEYAKGWKEADEIPGWSNPFHMIR